MKSRATNLTLLPVVAICAIGISARAQELDRTAPIVIPKPARTKPAKPPQGNFEVVNMTPTGIRVRNISNAYQVRTFSYAEPIRARMLNMLARNAGYRFGDKVRIQYLPDADVALKIKGKPSRPS
jgi:hypothetical protein